ncbi:hypothetical protein EIP91_002068 [Steccherinum ochraceum]|uniref:Protein kinase domain-containing protein n=1 Tax=Steccherinum ochraceum TaxID=92696 RepID=A0A4R0RTI2_9APHY|nr:hypothetical protein EIP91_002068 [Steccherinum ochraceum]
MPVDITPPRAPPVKYKTPLGTRWQKEKASAETGAFEFPDDAKFVGPWIIGECVGKGASGHVKIARHRRTGQLAAVKILPLAPFVNSRASLDSQAKSEKQRLGIDREITMMKLMNHPNIMRIFDVYEGEKQLYLILEYVEGGELFDFLVNRGKLPPLEALGYFKQIIYGLNYAHTFSIIHRDLKPENILIHSLNPPLIKIADWGMAAFAPPTLQLETSCGSPHYASPEIVNGHKYTGTATDIWSCGVILYALLTGRLPFDDKNVRTLLSKVKSGRYEMPVYIDPLAKDLLSRMLVVDVHKRITMAEILAHPWLEGPTPGITYVPAPSVHELAQPLPSPSHIDRDLFESLCVIWGRHADFEGIKGDLLSPAGHGTLAKAFYFLLLKHRERAMEEHGILLDATDMLNVPGKIIMKQYAAPRGRAKFLRTNIAASGAPPSGSSGHQQLRSTRAAPDPPSRTPSPARPIPMHISIPAPTERTSSRNHPPSPIGPRPQRPRPQSSPAPPLNAANAAFLFTPRSSDGTRPVSVRPPEPGRSLPPTFERPTTFLPQQHSTPRRSSPLPPILHAPTPIQAVQPPILPMITAPKVEDAELQKTFDHYASMVNVQAATWNATVHDTDMTLSPPAGFVIQPTASTQAQDHASEEDDGVVDMDIDEEECVVQPQVQVQDKENVIPGRKRAGTESGGLGFGTSVPMRDQGNTIYSKDPAANQMLKDRKDRKSRPPMLELASPTMSQKRPVFSSINSPTMSSPAAILGSPVVGEFKGWFSNLFHWKPQSYVLYSLDDPVATRHEIARLLEQLGVVIALEDNAERGWMTVKCRVDDVYEGTTLVQKAMRFRVEISSCQSQHLVLALGTPSTMSNATPRMSQSPLSPLIGGGGGGSGMSAKSRMSMPNGGGAGYETMIAFVLEKGAVSTFKTIYQHLRGEWRLDSLQSPRTSMPIETEHLSLEQRMMI